MMDYDFVITPGGRCTNCKNHAEVIQAKLRGGYSAPLVRCDVYNQINENDQAERCINYCEIASAHDAGKDGDA